MTFPLRGFWPTHRTATVMSSLLLEHLFFTPLKVRGGTKLSLTDLSLLWNPPTHEGVGLNMETRKTGPESDRPLGLKFCTSVGQGVCPGQSP